VPAYRLAKAERGSIQLNTAEERAVEKYYRARLSMVLQEANEQELDGFLEGAEVEAS
jgi:hypothetical protein